MGGQYGEAMDDVVELVEDTYGLDRRSAPHGPWRRLLRSTIHFFSYNFILRRRTTRVTRAAGFRLIVRPTVFHPPTSSRANSSHPISGGSISAVSEWWMWVRGREFSLSLRPGPAPRASPPLT